MIIIMGAGDGYIVYCVADGLAGRYGGHDESGRRADQAVHRYVRADGDATSDVERKIVHIKIKTTLSISLRNYLITEQLRL